MRRKRVIFWLGEPSPHQSSYLRDLAGLLPDETVVGVFQQGLQAERLALGWRVPDLGRMEMVMSPDQRIIEEIALREPDNTVHIFGGLRLPMVSRALRICAPTTALIGVLSEGRDLQGWSGKLRWLHSYVVEKRYRSRVDFVLAIGHLGVQWYEMCGYPRHRIFSWGYFVEKEKIETKQRSHQSRLSNVTIAFVGQCIPRKGIAALIKALSSLRSQEWCLRIIGDRPERPRLDRLAARLAVTKRVAFLGAKNNAEVRSMLAETDLLVLPSRFDGWGSIVNEALMSGVPVVCSDRCGAADLVRASGFGETFRTGLAGDLAKVLHRWIRKGHLTNSQRNEIQAWSKCIEGEAVARYLIEIIVHIDDGTKRPVAPWLQERSTAYLSSDNDKPLATHVRRNG